MPSPPWWGLRGWKFFILITLDRWKKHSQEKNYIENYFYLLKSTKDTKSTIQKRWRNIIWVDFFGCPYCTNGIKTCLGLLLDLHQVTKHAEIHHFADDRNLLYSSKSLKDINQKINFELKNIVHWLRANKISLNTKKTEIVLFRAQKTEIKKNMNFRISGQKIWKKQNI